VILRFDLQGFSEYEVALARMVALLTDLRPFWPRLVPIFIAWMREQFATEGEFLLGAQWAPLSPDYLARKMTLYPDKGILYATGQLRMQASKPRRIVTPTSITFELPEFTRKEGGTMDPGWFFTGTDRMPARPLWREVIGADQQLELEEAAQLYIDEMAAKLGLK
jgi:hypothetical protein